MSAPQILRAGERYATAADWEAVYDPDAPVATVPVPLPASFEGLTATYWVHVKRDGTYLVTYLPGGGGYATVVMADRATWLEAMDLVRDAIQTELAREGRRRMGDQ